MAEDVVVVLYFVVLAGLVVDLFVDVIVVLTICVVVAALKIVEVLEVLRWLVGAALFLFPDVTVTV